MNWEKIKSWILAGLVALSILLFWNLVTFQQNYDFISRNNYIKEINISEKREIKDLIFPNKIIVQTKDGAYEGTENIAHIKPLMEKIREWTFYDFQEQEQNKDLFQKKNRQEMVFLKFPDIVPFDLLKSLFNIEARRLPTGTFQYMIVNSGELEENEGTVYFSSADFQFLVKSRVRHPHMKDFSGAVSGFRKKAIPYLSYEKKDGSRLFVPENQVRLNDYQYYPKYYDLRLFINALFSDPSFVTRNGNRYTDVSSVLDDYPDMRKFVFVNTTVTLDSSMSASDVLQGSIQFVNGHSGWTDHYYYSGINQSSREVSYQLYLDDFPAINENGLSRITLVTGKNGVYSYQRPYFSLDISFNPGNRTYTLSSGRDVLDYLLERKSPEIENVDDIIIGYQLVKNSDDPLIQFIPSWFYRLEDHFVPVAEEELGGER